MHTRRRDLKIPLHVCFSRSATVHNAVLMDIGQELALTFCVGLFHKVILLVNGPLAGSISQIEPESLYQDQIKGSIRMIESAK
jgi:ABC-type dipeptide/oligopeptide/nickel transport system permease component